MLPGHGLRLPDEPLQGFLAALFLQFLPDHVPAGQVVIVEPVALYRKERRDTGLSTLSAKATRASSKRPTCRERNLRGELRKLLSPCSRTSDFLRSVALETDGLHGLQ